MWPLNKGGKKQLEVVPWASGVLSAKGNKRDAVIQQASVCCLCPNTMFRYVLFSSPVFHR